MNNITKSVNKIVLSGNVLEKTKHTELYKALRQIVDKKYKEVFSQKPWIAFELNYEKGYWNRTFQAAVPIQDTYDDDELEPTYFGIGIATLTEDLVVGLFNPRSNCPAEIMSGIKDSAPFNGGHWIGYKDGSYCVETERYADWNDADSTHVGIVKISAYEFEDKILSNRISVDKVMEQAVKVVNKRSIDELGEYDIDRLIQIFSIDRDKIAKDISNMVMHNFTATKDVFERCIVQRLLECDTTRADLEKYDRKCLEDVNSGHWDLWSDEQPAAKNGQALVTLEYPLRARNPVSDIHENGLIGIDFGTKSTIVSVQDGSEHITLLRIGIGKLNKAPEAYHYENPTIMEFINLDKFIRDYSSRSGRPETAIDDLRVSHAADRDLKACDNNTYFDSFFYDIKQWCGDDRRNVKIIDQQGTNTVRELPPFVNLKPGDFNPLELYAYYLGLYINNMREGIYCDYVLSFPVTYTLEVKNKILASFKAGLWKAMPEAVQNSPEGKKFRVRMGVSEPAAYAITALQEYGFDPEDQNEAYLYSIFDFGGGTTDFDFGIWRGSNYADPKEENQDYVIEHLNSEGDKYLGGENLLELLAFEVFKANNDFMRTGKENKADNSKSESVGFSFTMPQEEHIRPSGCETTINNSPSAKRNTKQLMEVLRPFWEGIIAADNSQKLNAQTAKVSTTKANEIDSPKSGTSVDTTDPANSSNIKKYRGYIFRNDEKVKFPISDDGAVTVDLFDNNGAFHPGQKLYIENNKKNINVDLVKILENRIERGIQSFFAAVMLSFGIDSVYNDICLYNNGKINIFLAGNSSKSPILRKLFDKYIQQENDKLNKGLQTTSKQSYFELFPPLGTKEALALQKQRGLNVNTDITAPTGKTGVAYGLIYGREGGPIRVISEVKAESQSKFMFNIGRSRKGKFIMVLDRNEAIYGQWVRFCAASSEDFEIYYTSLPGTAKMAITDSAIHKIRCRISATDVDPEANIYIRPIEEAPEELEYCVSKGQQPSNGTKAVRVHLDE